MGNKSIDEIIRQGIIDYVQDDPNIDFNKASDPSDHARKIAREIDLNKETEMDKIQEAYKVLQEASGLKVGDKVKVITYPSKIHNYGRDDYPVKENEATDIKKHIGEICTIMIQLAEFTRCIPFTCLELIEKAKPALTFGGSEATIADGKLTVQGESGTFDQVEAIYKAMLKEMS